MQLRDHTLLEQVMNWNLDSVESAKIRRRMRNMDEGMWYREAIEVRETQSYISKLIQAMLKANLAKFRQNRRLRSDLNATQGTLLVATRPSYNQFWGAGLHANMPSLKYRDSWPGANILGQCLMAVRERLWLEEEAPPVEQDKEWISDTTKVISQSAAKWLFEPQVGKSLC